MPAENGRGSLLDEVVAKHGRPGVGGCNFGSFLEEQEEWPLPEGKQRRFSRDEWQSILDNQQLQSTAIYKVAAEYGFSGGRSAVNRHRSGECICRRTS
jgi:hypothetical protein